MAIAVQSTSVAATLWGFEVATAFQFTSGEGVQKCGHVVARFVNELLPRSIFRKFFAAFVDGFGVIDSELIWDDSRRNFAIR